MSLRTAAIRTLALVSAPAIVAPATAAVTLITTITGPSNTSATDQLFEGPGGFLQTHYGLPLVPPANTTALPPIERAVGQVKSGNNVRRGLYVPTVASGLPAPGTGVTQALTNFPPLSGGSDTNFTKNTPVGFTFSRAGTTVTYAVGADSWSQTKSYYADVTGFEIRVRAEKPSTGTPSDSHSLTNLLFTDASTVNQALGSVSAADDQITIKLWNGVIGDFSITGDYTFDWTGAQPTGSRLASQIKLLDLPPEPGVPEPATWAMLITGFCLVGNAMRRRQALAA